MSFNVKKRAVDAHLRIYKEILGNAIVEEQLPWDYKKTIEFVIDTYLPNEKDKEIIREMYGIQTGNPLSTTEIADKHGLSAARVSVRHRRALRELATDNRVTVLLCIGFCCAEVSSMHTHLVRNVVPISYSSKSRYASPVKKQKEREAYYAKGAPRSGKKRAWTDYEDELVKSSKMSDTDLSLEIDRTIKAIQERRSTLRSRGVACEYKQTQERW